MSIYHSFYPTYVNKQTSVTSSLRENFIEPVKQSDDSNNSVNPSHGRNERQSNNNSLNELDLPHVPK